ncbi:insulinase family protein [Olsenella uli]|uniref:insulinase family protein n=1 Tax=Olsenella uli TaxID=133926 RepID=UPI0024A83F4F|nr:insulinase family protein [Olsenella uli]
MSDNTSARTPFTTCDPALAAGTSHAGFTVTSAMALPELSATAYVMRHDASGARALWIACDDDNKSFSIAFKTPPSDSTGVFHILEHSVLCGSDRFPVKEPFVSLLKTSMQTFLNAMTFPDKTMYPVASTNTQDLENLMDVYLDAVLHPAIYRRPRIFEQEGWHLELAERDGPLSYNGVVFNEMKGALSDPDDVMFQALSAALFPDTAYRHESGGNPRAIPTLSYERFLDAHARHYTLANSYTILYGNLDIDRELAFIARRFDGATEGGCGAPNPLDVQAPVRAPLARVEMATAPENASVGLAYVVGLATDRERVLATDVLLDAICGSNESPLKRAVLDAGLGDDLIASLIDGELQPQAMFQLKGARPGVAARFQRLVEDVCGRLVADGIDRTRLSASLAQAEFNLREGDWGSCGDGVALSMQVLSSWLYDDGHPVDYLRYQDAIDHMRAGLESGYFEGLLRGLICESMHCAAIELVPTTSGAADEEACELRDLKEGLTDAELDAIIAEVGCLRAEQEAPDEASDLAKLPRLGVDDIADAPEERPLAQVEAPLPCLYHDLPTHRIGYAYHYFDLRRLTFEELPYAAVLAELLGKLDTRAHSAAELDTLVEENLGSLDFFCETYGRDDDATFAHPVLVVGASALSERMAQLATIPSEVWSSTSFADDDRILAALTQRRVALEQGFANLGHSCASSRLAAHLSSSAAVADQMGGVGFYQFLKGLLAHWDERRDALASKLAELQRRVFTADEVTVSFTGSHEDLARFWEVGGTLGLAAVDGTSGEACAHRLEAPLPSPANEAFVIPSNVSFVVAGSPRSALDTGSIGDWQVAARALSFDYLWNEVRVKGGAYGVGFRRTTPGNLQFWSYRDPSVDATLGRYRTAAAWLAGWAGTQEELDGYIVSVIAAHDAPAKPRAVARRQDSEHFGARPADWRAQIRAQELAVTADGIRALARPLADRQEERLVCVFGPREAIEASSVRFDSIVDLMGNATSL